MGRASTQSQISFGSSVEENCKELKTLDPKLHILIYKCNGHKSELWGGDGIFYGFNAGNQFYQNHLKSSKWLPFITGGLFYWQIPLFLLFSSASAGFRVVGHSSNILSSFNIGEIRLPSDSVYGCWTNCNVNFYLMGVIILAVSLGLLI